MTQLDTEPLYASLNAHDGLALVLAHVSKVLIAAFTAYPVNEAVVKERQILIERTPRASLRRFDVFPCVRIKLFAFLVLELLWNLLIHLIHYIYIHVKSPKFVQ